MAPTLSRRFLLQAAGLCGAALVLFIVGNAAGLHLARAAAAWASVRELVVGSPEEPAQVKLAYGFALASTAMIACVALVIRRVVARVDAATATVAIDLLVPSVALVFATWSRLGAIRGMLGAGSNVGNLLSLASLAPGAWDARVLFASALVLWIGVTIRAWRIRRRVVRA